MLTPRQRQVAELAAKGLSSKQIAAAIGIKRGTVEKHIQQAAWRLGGGPARPRELLIVYVLTEAES